MSTTEISWACIFGHDWINYKTSTTKVGKTETVQRFWKCDKCGIDRFKDSAGRA